MRVWGAWERKISQQPPRAIMGGGQGGCPAMHMGIRASEVSGQRLTILVLYSAPNFVQAGCEAHRAAEVCAVLNAERRSEWKVDPPEIETPRR